MSRIGNTPIELPKEVSIAVSPETVVVKGPKGELTVRLPAGIVIRQEDRLLIVEQQKNGQALSALHGTLRAQVANAVKGVVTGWSKHLELFGVGYRASVSGEKLVLTIGFSHPVTVAPSPGITFAVQEGKIVVLGIDKHLVGQVAAQIRAIKPPEPYKGKGIRTVGEYVRKKAGKSAKTVGTATGMAIGGGK